MDQRTPDVDSEEMKSRQISGDADQSSRQKEKVLSTGGLLYVALLPWFLLVGYWLALSSATNSLRDTISIGGWILRSPHYLATHSATGPIYVVVICIVALLVLLGVTRKNTSILLIAVFILGVMMLVSGISLVVWRVGF